MADTDRTGPFVLVGIDGGATEVKTHQVIMEGPPDAPRFRLGDAGESRQYDRVVGFRPVEVTEQIRQRGAAQLTPAEREQGRRYVEAACQTVIDVARKTSARRILIGMGMPGLKSPEGRGVEVINNGPRIPDFLDRLEHGLTEAGLHLIAPVSRLGSDADYCGLGEEYAVEGMFRDVQNAYYVGGGTGIADAMKLQGRLVRFDEAKDWIQKAWQFPSCLGPTFEKLGSAMSLNTTYANLGGARPAEPARYPESEALRGDVLAESALDVTALVLAELIAERIHTIKNGRPELVHRGKAYLALSTSHPYRGTLLERVVIGQRVGRIYADPRFATVFKEKLDRCLARLIADSADPQLRECYLEGNTLRPNVVVPSQLREAPALGAAIDAVRSCPRASQA